MNITLNIKTIFYRKVIRELPEEIVLKSGGFIMKRSKMTSFIITIATFFGFMLAIQNASFCEEKVYRSVEYDENGKKRNTTQNLRTVPVFSLTVS